MKRLMFGVVALMAGLTACSDTTTLYRPVAFGSGPIHAAWNYGFAGKVALIEVHNAPATSSPADLAMRVRTPFDAAPVARFTSDSAQATDARYRMVLVFGAAPSFDGNAACALSGSTAKPTVAGNEVQAAFCQGSDRLSEIRLRVGVDHPQLGAGPADNDAELLRLVVEQLYSPRVGGGPEGATCSRLVGC